MHVDLLTLIAVIVVAMAACVKGATGFGFFLIALPVVSALLGARTAIVALTIPGMCANGLILFKARRSGWHRWGLWLVAGLLCGTVGGASLVPDIPSRYLTGLVGALALVLVAAQPVGRRLGVLVAESTRPAKGMDLLAGLVAGAVGGSSGLFGPILAPYLLLRRLEADAFVALLTALFLLGGMGQATVYALNRLFTARDVALGVVTCVPMLAGTWVGIALRARLQSNAFRVGVLALIVLTSLNLLRQALLG